MTNQNQKAFVEKIITSMGTLIEQQLGIVHGKIGTLSGEIGTLSGEIGTLSGEIGTLRSELVQQGKALHSEIGTIRGEIIRINKQIAKHIVDITDLKDEVHAALDGAMSAVKHEGQLVNHDERLSVVERDVKVVKAVLKNL
jgi:predicted  nucleic acid-binding Zn-ribbon protein